MAQATVVVTPSRKSISNHTLGYLRFVEAVPTAHPPLLLSCFKTCIIDEFLLWKAYRKRLNDGGVLPDRKSDKFRGGATERIVQQQRETKHTNDRMK